MPSLHRYVLVNKWKNTVEIRCYNGYEPKTVTCKDGHSFCWLCNAKGHEGKPCDSKKPICCLTYKYKVTRCPRWKSIKQVGKDKKLQDVRCDAWKCWYCWFCGEDFSVGVGYKDIKKHYSFLSVCNRGIMPTWLIIMFYLFLPIIMGLIPYYYTSKFLHKIWGNGSNVSDTGSSDNEWIGAICSIFYLIVFFIAILFVLASPVVYFCLIVYHIDLCRKWKQRQKNYEEKKVTKLVLDIV